MQPPKKITIISDFAYPIVGGTEKYVYEAGEHFSKKNKVTIISPIWSTEKKEENFLLKKINKKVFPVSIHDYQSLEKLKKISHDGALIGNSW